MSEDIIVNEAPKHGTEGTVGKAKRFATRAIHEIKQFAKSFGARIAGLFKRNS